MSQMIRTFRVGTDPATLAGLVDENAVEIFGVEPDAREPGPQQLSWSTDQVRQGRMELVSEAPGKTMLRLSVTTGPDADAQGILDEVAERLSHVLPEGKGLERPAMIVEPHPGEPPEDETSRDQPL
ncbi:MAG TPA: hypothetical protein VJ948_08715 [Acidimicrobiia bacterium]|nr:hypothetical protein [Acidimicrobiia bacterium]